MEGFNSESKGLDSIRLRRSLPSIYISVLPLLLPAAIFYLLFSIYPNFVPFDSIRHGYLSLYEILRVVVVLELARRYLNELYIFDGNTVSQKHGLLSVSLHSASVEYAHIRELRVEQSIAGRIFGYGDLMISTAAKDGDEVVLSGVTTPRNLLQLIEERQASAYF